MQRVKISLPDQFDFTCDMVVRITDLNYGGHVGNDVFLSWIHHARQQYLNHYGYSEMNIEGVGLIMADAALEYKREIFYGDNVKISVGRGEHSRIGIDLLYRVEVEVDRQWLVAAKGKTGMIFFDYGKKKTVGIPETVLQKLK